MAGTLNCDVLLFPLPPIPPLLPPTPPVTVEVGGGGGSDDVSPGKVGNLSVLVDSSRSLDWSCWVTTWRERRNQAELSREEAAIEFKLSRNFVTRSW